MRQQHPLRQASLLARTLTLVAATAALVVVPTHAQSKPDSVVAPDGGAAMCSKALKAADFARVGLTVGEPNASSDSGDPSSSYCLYPNPTGKIEVDVFYGAGATAVQAIQIERTAMGADGPQVQYKPVELADADGPQMASCGTGADLHKYTCLVFRRGIAVVSIMIPTTPSAHDQVLALARVVIGRIHRT
jgi:hypothetical protein